MNTLIFKINNNISVRTNYKFHQHNDITSAMLTDIIRKNESEILRKYENEDATICITHDFGHCVGLTTCIECERGDKNIYFAQRGKRPYLSRMIRNAKPQPTNKVTIVLRKTDNGLLLLTAWCGEKAAPELGNVTYFENCKNVEEEILASAQFWLTHALIDEETENKSQQRNYQRRA